MARGAEAELAALRAGTALPTPEAVAAAREARDAHLADVRARLLRERSSEDGMAADELAGAVARADDIADRRDADAARVAAYTIHCAARDRAVSLGELAEAQIEAEATRLEAAEGEWAALLGRVGLARAITPTAFASWCRDRDRVLEIAEQARMAEEAHADASAADRKAKAALRGALVATGAVPPEEEAVLIERSRARLHALDAQAKRWTAVVSAREQLEGQTRACVQEAQGHVRDRTRLLAERADIARQTGLLPTIDEAALSDALEAFDAIATEMAARDPIARQVAGIGNSAESFRRDTDTLFATVKRPTPPQLFDGVRALGAELRSAVLDAEKLERLKARRRPRPRGRESSRRRGDQRRSHHWTADADCRGRKTKPSWPISSRVVSRCPRFDGLKPKRLPNLPRSPTRTASSV